MSQEHVEIVQEHFEGVNRRDWAAVMAAYDEEVVLVVHANVAPDAGVFNGREAVGRWFGDWFRVFGKDYRFEIEEAQSVGEHVLAVARHHRRGRVSGAEVEQVTANLYTLRRAKIVRMELYASATEALKAVELAESAMSANLDLVRSIYAAWGVRPELEVLIE
jgi:ketosteroid isomerase-like protein